MHCPALGGSQDTLEEGEGGEEREGKIEGGEDPEEMKGKICNNIIIVITYVNIGLRFFIC